jgi:hypothetical protein
VVLCWASILLGDFSFFQKRRWIGEFCFGFRSSGGVLGVIWFLVNYFVSDLELLDYFGAPVVIWCRTAYCSGEE